MNCITFVAHFKPIQSFKAVFRSLNLYLARAFLEFRKANKADAEYHNILPLITNKFSLPWFLCTVLCIITLPTS